MKKLKILSVSIIIMLCSGLFIFLPSCDKNDNPVYIGSWESVDTIYSDEITYIATRSLTMTEKSYTEAYVIVRESTGTIVMILGLMGDLTVKNNDMTFKLKELGTCVRDSQDKCTSDILWYGSGTEYYTDNIGYFRLTVKGEYEAEGSYMWIVRDMNGDGDSEDTGENIEFEKI